MSLPIRKNAFIGTFGANLFIQICTILQGVLLARILGPAGRGELAAIILWPQMFAALGLFGCHIAIARAAATCIDKEPLIRSAVLISIVTSLISGILCFFAIPDLLINYDILIVDAGRLFVLFIPLNHLLTNLNSVDQGTGNFKIYNVARGLFYPLYLLLITIFWLIEYRTPHKIMMAFLIAYFCVTVFRFIISTASIKIISNIYKISEVVKTSTKFGLSGIGEVICSNADKALILWMLNTENLGFYTVAMSASLAASSITSSAGIVIFTQSAREDQAQGYEKVTKVFRISAFLWLISGLFLAAFMGLLLPLIYGRDFVDAINPARLLIIGSALSGLSSILEQSLKAQGRPFIGLSGKIASLFVMLFVSYIVVDKLYTSGICIAYICGQITCLIIMIITSSKHYKKRLNIKDYMPIKFIEIVGSYKNQ